MIMEIFSVLLATIYERNPPFTDGLLCKGLEMRSSYTSLSCWLEQIVEQEVHLAAIWEAMRLTLSHYYDNVRLICPLGEVI